MNLCLLLQPGLPSDDEADGTHRKLLGDTQQELRCCAAGWAALMLGKWIGTTSIAQVKAGACSRNRIIPWNKGVWAPTSWEPMCKTGYPSTTSASGGQ